MILVNKKVINTLRYLEGQKIKYNISNNSEKRIVQENIKNKERNKCK